MNLIQLTFYNAEFLVNWLGADFHFIIWHCSTENFPNPRQKTFLLKCKIFLFRSRSDRKYLAWKIHQVTLLFGFRFLYLLCTHIKQQWNTILVFWGENFQNWIFFEGFCLMWILWTCLQRLRNVFRGRKYNWIRFWNRRRFSLKFEIRLCVLG